MARLCLGGEDGGDAVVGLADEGAYLVLTFHNKAYCHRLYTSGRQGGLQATPQHRRQFETDNAVEHAAGLLGVDARNIDIARCFDGVQYGALGNFVENYAACVVGFQP